jgi:hypothetical protein
MAGCVLEIDFVYDTPNSTKSCAIRLVGASGEMTDITALLKEFEQGDEDAAPPTAFDSLRVVTEATVHEVPYLGKSQTLYWAREPKCAGLGVRVLPSGTRAYIFRGRIKQYDTVAGERSNERRLTLGRCTQLTWYEAQVRALAASYAMTDGVDPSVSWPQTIAVYGARAERALLEE